VAENLAEKSKVIKSMDIDINQLSFYADSEYGQIIA
jgi:hypothetical protein